MRCPLLVSVTMLSTLAASCTGDDDDDVAPPAVSCDATSSVRLQGTVASIGIDVAGSGGGTFSNAFGSGPGYLDISLIYGTAGQTATVYVEFEELLVRDGSVPARGHAIASSVGLSAGNCETGALESRIWSIDLADPDAEEYRWELRALHEDPYCTGPAVTGSLTGCWYIEPF